MKNQMGIRLLQIKDDRDALCQMQNLGVEETGIRIMSGKARFLTIKLEKIDALLANVLKQEMLSLGGEVAVPREVITGKLKRSDCLIFGTYSQCRKLIQKLKRQPWGLDKTGSEINAVIRNMSKQSWRIKAGKFTLNLGKKTLLMGVLNITPDSFSDGAKFYETDKAVRHALQMEKDGADIIDVGGESTRPGAKGVPVAVELQRVIPAIEILSKSLHIPISIDTRKSEVARQALKAGAAMVNDVSGLRFDPAMKKVLARFRVPVVIMHMKGNPRTMQKKPVYKSLLSEIIVYLKESIDMAVNAGISRENIIVDPGIGFGKNLRHNLEILRNLSELKVLGRPVLVGTSRKSFIGKVLKIDVKDRLSATIASSCLAIVNGAHILRVHDVKELKQAALLIDCIIRLNICD